MNPYLGMPGQQMQGPATPGLIGQTAAGLGMGTGYYDAMAAQQAAGSLYGGGMVSAVSGVPTALATGIGLAGMVSPFMLAGLEGPGMGRALARGAFYAADAMDPTSYILPAAARGGGLAYRGAATAFGIRGAGMEAISAAFSSGGMRAGLGMLGRFGGAGLAGGVGALAGAALPIAAGLAAYQGLDYLGSTFYRGAEETMGGQALLSQLGPSIAPGQRNIQGAGSDIGRMMRSMSMDLGVDTEDLNRYAQDLNNQKVFQTTKSVREFQTKFKEVMGAIKEIANITKSSIDDAAQMFGDLRQQGFYTTADIKAQAASRQAREMATGISAGVYSAIGGVGAQTARQFGLRGRFGADLAERNVASIAMGVRSGLMSEEEVMEMGGSEAVGTRMAQQQMGFLQSSRGRAMIAYAMGEGRAPDPARLNRMLRGTSIEDIVTGASGRGLGVLMAAGTREAQEQFAPYAGMAMVQMAAAQQRQLFGGVSERGIINMLGTMGVGRQEALLMLQGTMQMPEQLRREQIEAMNVATGDAARELDRRYSISRNVARGLEMNIGRSVAGQGSVLYGSLSSGYTNLLERMMGTETYTGGDDSLARGFLSRGGTNVLAGGRENAMSPFAVGSASDRLRNQYREVLMNRSQLGMSDDQLQAALRSGDLVDLGPSVAGVGRAVAREGGQYRYARRDALNSAEAAYTQGRRLGAGTGVTDLRASFGRGDFMSRLHSDRRRSLMNAAAGQGMGGMLNAALANEAMDVGIGSMTLADLDVTGNLQHFEQMHDIYFVAKEAKLLDQSVTFGDFMRRRVEERQRTEGMVRSALEASAAKGDETAEKMLYRLGQRDDRLLNVRDIQAARDQFQGQLTQLLNNEFGGFGSSIFGGKQVKLALTLTKDGEARAAYDGFLRAMVDGDKERLVTYQDKLREKFGEDSPEYRAIVSQRQQLEDDPKKMAAFKEKFGQIQNLFGDRAYLEKVYRDSEGLRQRVSGVRMEDIRDPRLRDTVAKLSRAASTGNIEMRGSAMKDLILGSISGGISTEERDLLNQIGGGGQGEAISSIIGAVQKGGKGLTDADKAMLKEGGYGTEKLKEIAKLQGEAQAEALKKMFQDLGLTDLAAFQNSEGAVSKRGVEAKYLEANEQFVQSVHAFVSALSAAGIKGVPSVAGPASSVQSAGQDLKEGSNTGGGFWPWE